MVSLRDGTPVWTRPVQPEDRAVIADIVARLSERSRRRRFLAEIKEASDSLLTTLVDEVDGVNHLAVLMFVGIECIGVGRLIRMPGEPGVADGAVTVLDEWQGRGAGTLLVKELLARAPDVRQLVAQLTADNEPSRRLLASLGPIQEHLDQGVRDIAVDLSAAPAA